MSALRDFEDNLAIKPYCSHDLHRLIIRSRNKAVNYPYIQANQAGKVTWLVFDVDRGDDSALSYENANLPEPNLIVKNRSSGNSHLFWQLQQPIWTHTTAGIKAQSYYKAVRAGITAGIKADSGYCGLICKNPLHDDWDTYELHSGKFALVDLGDCVNLKWKQENERIAETTTTANAILGRNCSLFETLRFFSYAKVADYRESNMNRMYGMWLKAVESEAVVINRN